MALKSYRGLRFGTHLNCECLDSYWFSSWLGYFWPSGGQKHLKGGVTRAPSLFCTCFEISVWNLAYTCTGWCHMSGSSFILVWTLWLTLQPNIAQIHLSAYMALKLYRGLRFGTHSNSECLDPYWFLSCLGNFWPSGGQKQSKGGVSRAPNQRYMRFEFHQNQVSASEEFSGLFSKCLVVSTWKLVYTLSRLHNILSSCFTRMGSLWPSSCS